MLIIAFTCYSHINKAFHTPCAISIFIFIRLRAAYFCIINWAGASKIQFFKFKIEICNFKIGIFFLILKFPTLFLVQSFQICNEIFKVKETWLSKNIKYNFYLKRDHYKTFKKRKVYTLKLICIFSGNIKLINHFDKN